jgi:hypothetical protein
LEVTELFAKTLNQIHQFMENFDEDEFDKIDAILFEKCLMTLCHFCIGGQRREFIVNFTLEV